MKNIQERLRTQGPACPTSWRRGFSSVKASYYTVQRRIVRFLIYFLYLSCAVLLSLGLYKAVHSIGDRGSTRAGAMDKRTEKWQLFEGMLPEGSASTRALTEGGEVQTSLSAWGHAVQTSTFTDVVGTPTFAGDRMYRANGVSPGRVSSASVVLIFLQPRPTIELSLSDTKELLTKHKIRFETVSGDQTFPRTFLRPAQKRDASDEGKYSLIVFENITLYSNLDSTKRLRLENYCRKFAVGMIIFSAPDAEQFEEQRLRLSVRHVGRVCDMHLNAESKVLRIAKGGQVLAHPPGDAWAAFHVSHKTYEAVLYASSQTGDEKLHIVVADLGKLDGIRRVHFGANLTFWLHKILFLDAIRFLSPQELILGFSLRRRILVDIDDTFVAPRGTKVTVADVNSLLKAQEHVRKHVKDFTFNLGFVGAKYGYGFAREKAGDEHIVKNAHHFWWFPHMFNHTEPHRHNNVTWLMELMRANRRFALKHGIPVNSGYAISPKHSGVYPVHEPLYTCWKAVWNIEATSTEEYFHFKPAYKRRGFIYRGIRVLPRQTCGLYTHTYLRSTYPQGFKHLEENAHGGDMFETIVHNPISIFMTHISNYGNDRLGQYLITEVVEFLNNWTNLQLSSAPPRQLAEEYFKLFVDEKQPYWLDPCRDPRHYKLWSHVNRCYNLPNVIIVGPQKTGTTALLDFLMMHPNISRNVNTRHFEETQFFVGKNYNQGLNWYAKLFPVIHNETNLTIMVNETRMYDFPSHIIVEKSANYFDDFDTPLRVWRLLPAAKIIVIIVNPNDRAYSWYQHQLAHQDQTAQRITFSQLVAHAHKHHNSRAMLRSRCLLPGLYAYHLSRWLTFFGKKQILVIDGVQLVEDPVSVMDTVQKFLNIAVINYNKLLKMSPKKGFFCKLVDGKTKCLGQGKGRHYPPMSNRAKKHLTNYFHNSNEKLRVLLTSMGVPIPKWLQLESENPAVGK